jgi:hypothetical protein
MKEQELLNLGFEKIQEGSESDPLVSYAYNNFILNGPNEVVPRYYDRTLDLKEETFRIDGFLNPDNPISPDKLTKKDILMFIGKMLSNLRNGKAFLEKLLRTKDLLTVNYDLSEWTVFRLDNSNLQYGFRLNMMEWQMTLTDDPGKGDLPTYRISRTCTALDDRPMITPFIDRINAAISELTRYCKVIFRKESPEPSSDDTRLFRKHQPVSIAIPEKSLNHFNLILDKFHRFEDGVVPFWGITLLHGDIDLDIIAKAASDHQCVPELGRKGKTVYGRVEMDQEKHLILQGIDTVEEGDMYILRYPEIVTVSPLGTTRSLYAPRQVDVMNRLVELSKRNVNVVIVSNSDYALLGLRIAVGEKRLSCKDFIIDYFTDDGVTISYVDIPVDPNGSLQFWPKGFDYFTEYLLKLV